MNTKTRESSPTVTASVRLPLPHYMWLGDLARERGMVKSTGNPNISTIIAWLVAQAIRQDEESGNDNTE